MYYSSQPESTGELVTMVTRKVFLCDDDAQIVRFMGCFFSPFLSASREDERQLCTS